MWGRSTSTSCHPTTQALHCTGSMERKLTHLGLLLIWAFGRHAIFSFPLHFSLHFSFFLASLRLQVEPYCYSLRHHATAASGFARSWELQGQYNNSWCRISVHKNDVSFSSERQRVCYPILPSGKSRYYSRFRVIMTGPNHANTWRFCVASLEFYGHLRRTASSTLGFPIATPKSKPTEGHVMIQKQTKSAWKDAKWFQDVLDTHRSIQVLIGPARMFPASFSVKVWTSYLSQVGWNPQSLSLGCPTTQSSQEGTGTPRVSGYESFSRSFPKCRGRVFTRQRHHVYEDQSGGEPVVGS